MSKYKDRFLKADEKVLRFINSKLRTPILNAIMILFTMIASVSGIAVLVLSLYLSKIPKLRHLSYKISISIIITAWVVKVIKHIFTRIRPYVKFSNLNTKKIGIDKYSFPSGHTAAAFTMAVTVSFLFPQFKYYALLVSLLVGVSRIYLGVHYPSDVIAGGIIGSIVATFVNLIKI